MSIAYTQRSLELFEMEELHSKMNPVKKDTPGGATAEDTSPPHKG